jgi:hypothetical protein
MLRRRLLNSLMALSLLLSLAICGLWVRSYRIHDTVIRVIRGDLLQAFTMPGRLYVRLSTGNWINGGGFGHAARPSEPIDHAFRWEAYTDWNAVGIGYRHEPFMAATASESHEVSLPLAYLLLPCAAAPAAFVALRVRTRTRRRAGRCPACGYDLRATPDRCPECGAAPELAGAGT